MLLYKSHYLTVNYLETKYLAFLQWTKPSDLLDETGYYSEILNFINKRIKRPARYILWDMLVIQDRIDKSFIDWIENYILPELLSIKAQKIAFVINNELAKDIIIEEKTFRNKKVEVKIFTSVSDGMKWLTENSSTIIRGRRKHNEK